MGDSTTYNQLLVKRNFYETNSDKKSNPYKKTYRKGSIANHIF